MRHNCTTKKCISWIPSGTVTVNSIPENVAESMNDSSISDGHSDQNLNKNKSERVCDCAPKIQNL